jgi:hypothetical protein
MLTASQLINSAWPAKVSFAIRLKKIEITQRFICHADLLGRKLMNSIPFQRSGSVNVWRESAVAVTLKEKSSLQNRPWRLDGDGWTTPRPDRVTPGKETRYPRYRRLGRRQGRSGRVRNIEPPTGFRSPDRAAHSESTYRLCHPGPQLKHYLFSKLARRMCIILYPADWKCERATLKII